MTENTRSIEIEIEVPGTPEQVWQAIATGPGITSWYVPHKVDEVEGGEMTASFGEGPEMQVSGKVAKWDPPRQVLFGGEDIDAGLAFEWTVEAVDGGTCIVRLVNSGFGVGGEWDAQFDCMHEGWQLFLSNLRLHLTHFAGQSGHAQMPMAMIEADVETVWSALTTRLGLPSSPATGDLVTLDAEGVPTLTGTVAEVINVSGPQRGKRVLLLVDQPAPGTAFVAAEHHGSITAVSVWTYLYGESGAVAGTRDAPTFQEILNNLL